MFTFPIQLTDGSTLIFDVDRIYTNKRYSNYYSKPSCGIAFALYISHVVRKGVIKSVTFTLVQFTTTRLYNKEYVNHSSRKVIASSTEKY